MPFKLTKDSSVREARFPTRGSIESAGWDLYTPSSFVIEPSGGRATVDTGIKIVELPLHTYLRIAPRSGLAINHGIQILGGVVDRDYKGNIKVGLINHGTDSYGIVRGNRIAQFIVEKYDTVEYEEVEEEEEEEENKRRNPEGEEDPSPPKKTRGSCGFGSTGK